MGPPLASRSRRPPAPVTGGFNWVAVRDFIDTAPRAEEQDRKGESSIVGGCRASIRELADVTASCAGVQAPMITLPLGLLEATAPLRSLLDPFTEGEAMFTRGAMPALRANPVIDSALAPSELAHVSRPLEEAIADRAERLQRWVGGVGA